MSPSKTGHDRRRWTIGLFVSADCRRVTGAAIAAHGAGFEARADIEATAAATISPHSRKLFRELARGHSRRPAALASVVAAELADSQAACLQKLVAIAPTLRDRAICVSVADPGLWREESSEDRACLSLCDGARLAELTGMNVLDAFPARDVAQGGRGGPLLAAPYWLLLRDATRTRTVLHLSELTQVTLLPAARDATAIDQVGTASIGIGPRLIGMLARRLVATGDAPSVGLASVDVATGAVRPELIERWQADAAIGLALANVWRATAIAPRPIVDAILQAIHTLQIPTADAMRTIVRWIAQLIAARMSEIGVSAAAGDVLLAGPGRRHELLRADLTTLLPAARLLGDAEIGFPISALDAAATAWWGQLYLDQTPGNLPALTGANAPRVLGRFTPGSPQNFLRLVRTMASQQPVVSLRTAI